MPTDVSRRLSAIGLSLVMLLAFVPAAPAAQPTPVLNNVSPAGGRVGESVEVTVSGSGLDGIETLRLTTPGVRVESLGKNRFRLAIPATTPPGLYDLRVVCANGLSSPRTFQVGNRLELVESEPSETVATAVAVKLDSTVNGKITPGDRDCFAFSARDGQRVVIECFTHRIDSQLRAILTLFDKRGRQLAVSRGYHGIDPLIDFRVPADGDYVIRIHDLVYSGGDNHYYRLDIDTGPRVAFAVPSVIRGGESTTVRLFGWNLAAKRGPGGAGRPGPGSESGFDELRVVIPASRARAEWPLPLRLPAAATVIDGLAWHHPGTQAPVLIGVTNVPVILEADNNASAAVAQPIPVPCEVSGQLVRGDERDWFAFEARRGEVFHLEALGQRIGSPVDLELSVWDEPGRRELFQAVDQVESIGGKLLPTAHTDPAGRWVAPADGSYRLVIRTVIGRLQADPRRVYRLIVRREEPIFDLAVIPHRASTGAFNLSRGGREVFDVIAFRRRGHAGPIRITARDLPDGVECPDIWLGPGINRGQLVLSADRGAPAFAGSVTLEGFSDRVARRPVRGGAVVRSGRPNGWGRLTAEIPLAVVGKAPLRITANGHETRKHHLYGELTVRHAPGCVLDVAVEVERQDPDHRTPVALTGVGLPGLIRNQQATIPADTDKGYISFFLPSNLPLGRYSLGIRGQTTVPSADGKKTESVTVFANPVSFTVHPPMFRVALDPSNPRTIGRGKIVQVKYTVQRMNGFINKVHSELASPSVVTRVPGLRGRGVTFVGQTESGTIQVIANDDAPLGQLPFLRVYAVGVLEDEAVYHGSCFLPLAVVE